MTKLNDIFPSDFKTILDSLYFEENGGLVISTLQYLNDDLKVLFTLSYSDKKNYSRLGKLIL